MQIDLPLDFDPGLARRSLTVYPPAFSEGGRRYAKGGIKSSASALRLSLLDLALIMGSRVRVRAPTRPRIEQHFRGCGPYN